MTIDKEHPAYKIEVMTHFMNGGEVQSYCSNTDTWRDNDRPTWALDVVNYRIKPMTVGEAAEKYCSERHTWADNRFLIVDAFKAGAQWQKENSE